MLFKKSDHKNKGFGIFGIFRVFLSLIIIAIFLMGAYLSFKSFSGFDPLKIDPIISSKQGIKDLVFSDSVYELVTGILSVEPKVSLDRFKAILRKDSKIIPDLNTEDNLIASGQLLYSFGVVADSHSDNANLKKALSLSKQKGVKFIIGLGDYSKVGTIDELRLVKKEFESSGLPYYLTLGDHDLWDSRNKNLNPSQNFFQVFGSSPYFAFTQQNSRFLIIYNSDNYIGVDGVQFDFIEKELKNYSKGQTPLLFIFSHIPLFHPSSDHVMGKSTPKLKEQAMRLIQTFSDYDVKEVFSGDAHFSSSYSEPNSGLKMSVVGALTTERNLQTPRFSIIDVYSDGSYNIQDIEVQ